MRKLRTCKERRIKVCINYIFAKIRGDIESEKKEQGETKKEHSEAKRNSWTLKKAEQKDSIVSLLEREKNQSLNNWKENKKKLEG